MSITYSATPFSEQNNYQPSNLNTKLPFSRSLSPLIVGASEETQRYRDFSWWAGGGYNATTQEERVGELANRNSEYTKKYIEALVHHLKLTSPESFETMEDGTERYKGVKVSDVENPEEASVLQQDENGYYINTAAWLKARYDRLHGFIHDFAFENIEDMDRYNNSVLPSVEDPGTLSNEGSGDMTNNHVVFSDHVNPFNIDLSSRPIRADYVPWTDWIPHTLQLMNANFTNNKLAKLQQRMSFPKRIAPQKNAILTDAYAQRLMLEKQKQEMLARTDAVGVSNIDQKMAIMRQAEELAEKYTDALSKLQAAEYAQTKKEVNDTENWNLGKRAEVADHNMKVNSAAYNNWLNAEKQKATSNSAARKSYLYDMYKDYGLYKQDQRLNERAFKESKLKLDLSDRLTQLSDLHSRMTDPYAWKFLSLYAVDFVRQGDTAGLSESDKSVINACAGDSNKLITMLNLNARLRDLLVSKLLTGQDEISKSYRSAYEFEKSRLDQEYDSAFNAAYRQYEGQRASLPITVSNQIFKKGGKLKVLQEVVKQNQREKESNRKASSDFHKRTSKELARQLDALDKEQLMLLKSIFS